MPSPFTWNIAFHSGFTADSDLQAALDVGIAIGVVADRVTLRQQLRSLPDHLDRGGKVFIDSGAFTAFRRQQPMDWPRVLTLFPHIMSDGTDVAAHQRGRIRDCVPVGPGNLHIAADFGANVRLLP